MCQFLAHSTMSEEGLTFNNTGLHAEFGTNVTYVMMKF